MPRPGRFEPVLQQRRHWDRDTRSYVETQHVVVPLKGQQWHSWWKKALRLGIPFWRMLDHHASLQAKKRGVDSVSFTRENVHLSRLSLLGLYRDGAMPLLDYEDEV